MKHQLEDIEKPDLNKPAFKIFPEMARNIKGGKCSVCGKKIRKFKDSLSKKEYSISGMCQSCQDKVFI